MKKRFLSLLLVLFLLPSIFLFGGCGEEGYKLTNLEADYKKMVSNCDNITMQDNKIVFDYTNHKLGNQEYLVEAINVAPYNQINNYNALFDNLMGFVYEYVDVCSNKNIDASNEIKNNLKQDLDNLSIAINDVDAYINQWAELIQFHYNDDITNEQCVARFKTLLASYNNLYQSAINFSNAVADLYYNYALNDSNPRIDNIELDKFDASVIISKLQGRVKYQVSNLSQVFVEKYIDGQDLETVITTKDEEYGFVGVLDLNISAYLDKVNSIERVFGAGFDAETAVTIANGASKKQDFYDYAIQAYNMQNILDNDNSMFISACNKVAYGKANLEFDDQAKYKEIIDDYNAVVNNYNSVLVSMIDLLGL